MRKILRAFMSIMILIAITLVAGYFFYQEQLKPVSTSDTEIMFEISEGEYLNNILERLENERLIKSAFVAKIFTKVNNLSGFKYGAYLFSESLSTEEILNQMIQGSDYYPDQISVTFVEGLNIKQVAMVIEEHTSHSYETVMEKLNDQAYIDDLITKHWFLTDEIKHSDIYYPLDGYLFPNTYTLTSKDASIDEIISKMLEQTDKVLSKYKDSFQTEGLDTIHKYLTLASIVELEAPFYEGRQGVASVFLNRIDSKMPLGSCVTSYYGVGVLMSERNLYVSEFADSNPYNTRGGLLGLPVGPVANPSEEALKAIVERVNEDFLYFVSDKERNLYFTSTYQEHLQMVAKLKKEGRWLDW